MIFSLLIFTIFNIVSFIGETQFREPTELRIEPSSFEILADESIILTATLTTRGQPLPGKTIFSQLLLVKLM